MSISSNYTAIGLVVDRSGSMSDIANDVKGGVKSYIEEQKKVPGKASLTISQFDDKYENVYNFVDLKEVDEQKFVDQYKPRGSTALLDAVASAIFDMQNNINILPEAERPQRVVVVIYTDGEENSSQKYTIEKIKSLIEEKQNLGWDFMYLGATLDAIEVANTLGISKSNAVYCKTECFAESMKVVGQQMTSARTGGKISFSDEDRSSMVGSGSVFKNPFTTGSCVDDEGPESSSSDVIGSIKNTASSLTEKLSNWFSSSSDASKI